MVVYSEDWDEEGEEARNERRGDLFVFNNTNSESHMDSPCEQRCFELSVQRHGQCSACDHDRDDHGLSAILELSVTEDAGSSWLLWRLTAFDPVFPVAGTDMFPPLPL